MDMAGRAVKQKVPHASEDPVLRSLMDAPEDDEPETPEEAAEMEAARAEIQAGEVLSTDELKRQLGL
jgi:hypothetical protein